MGRHAVMSSVVALLISVATTLVLTSSVLADSITYKNARYGTQITLPARLFTQIAPPPANGDGITLTHPDGGSIAIYAGHNALGDTPRTAAESLRNETGVDFTITYDRVADDWLVQSGFEGDMIFYMRLEFGDDGIVHGFLMKWPESQRAKYDDAVGPIGQSLGPN